MMVVRERSKRADNGKIEIVFKVKVKVINNQLGKNKYNKNKLVSYLKKQQPEPGPILN